MVSRRVTLVLAAVLVFGLLVFLFTNPVLFVLEPEDYERGTARIVDENGTTEKGAVDVRIADTWEQQYVGLSETESLAADEGMLFVHDTEATQSYVMRDMDFPLDIVFVAENGTITTIHEAPTKDAAEGDPEPYEGTARYVLEVNRGWTDEHGVTVGDRLLLPAQYRQATVVTDDESGAVRGYADVTIADNSSERYTGLSETESLGPTEGMLFVHSEETVQGYVMRNMSFPLDIVFVADNGTITAIHEAPTREAVGTAPEPYSGRARYVLEVNRGWTAARGIEVGDEVLLPAAAGT